MNTTILTKCIEELKKDAPNISYIQGMLETLLELGGANQTRDLPPYSPYQQPQFTMPQPIYTATNASVPVEEEGSGLVSLYNGNPGQIGGKV